MADPLSLTLSVISLATALKDVIELAQKLNDSFKQHALNMQEAKSLAEETLEIVQDIKKSYRRHAKTLDEDTDLRESVTVLLRDIKSVYEDTLPILDSGRTSKNKLQKFKYTINTWKKRKEVERRIRILKDQANRCYRRFAISTQLDTAAGVVHLRGAVTSVVHGLAAIHSQQFPLRISVEDVVAFMGSNPGILSNLPPHIRLPEHLVYRSYITLQVAKIDTLFKALASRGSYLIEEPDSFHLKPFQTVVYLKPFTEEEMENVQSDVFSLLVKIEDSLKSRDNRPSIHRGTRAMCSLSVRLSNLGMHQESLTIVQFAVELYRTLVKTNEDIYGPRLAHALCLMSSRYVDTGDVVEAYKVITEAVTLGRRLAEENPTFDAQMQLAGLVCTSALVGRRNGDWTNALKDAEEAVQSYQHLIANRKSMLPMEVGIVEGPRMTLEGTQVRDYADALAELHYSLSMTTRHDESVKVGVQALEIYRDFEQKHKHGAFSDELAHLFSSLASNDFREIVSIHQALLYARESVHHYEKILQTTGVIPNDLPDALGLEGELLSKSDRVDEAYGVCQKLEHMIQIYMDSQELRTRSLLQLTINLFNSKRYAEAALAGEQLLSMHGSLASNWDVFDAYTYTYYALAWIGDRSKALQVAEASVAYWRMLALRKTENLQFVARGIFALVRCRTAVPENDYKQAFNEGGEALKLFNSLIAEDATLLGDYMDALQLNIEIAMEANMELESLNRSRLVVQYSRALVNQFPDQQLFLIRRIQDHAKLLTDFDHLADASAAISEALDWFDDHPTQDSESTELHMNCLIDLSRSLLYQGHPERVLSLHDKAISIGQPFLDVRSVAWSILWSMTHNLRALYFMGQISTALNEINVFLNFASRHNLEQAGAYTVCLDIVSHLYRCAWRLDYGLVTIQRSIALDRENAETPSSWLLSDLLADTGEEAEALTAAYETVQETEHWIDSSNSFDEELHVQAQYSLSLRLFADGELTQAQELLVQVHSFYHEHSMSINLWFINLATTLWALGHLECASGRHEEGIAARTELNELRKRLRLVFPSLADLVEVGLNRERNFVAWKRLLEKYNLSCGHQDDDEISEDNTDSSVSQGARVTSPNHILATGNSATSHS